ncbi:MAG: hypothetical protein ABFQ95_06560 [Pseudomonadota bacterium]
MYFLNHTYIVGRLPENPHIFSDGEGGNLATFTLLTPVDGGERLEKHHISVENPLLVEYVSSCLCEGNLVFVAGRLEPSSLDSGPSWIVISKTFGGLHPINSHVHMPLPEIASSSDN